MSAQCSFSQVIINLSYVGVPYHVAPWIRWSTVSCNNYKLKTALTSHKWRLINNEISAQRRRKQCELAVVKREPKISPRRRPNSRSNRPTNTQTHKHTNPQTHRQGILQYTAPQLSAQCNNNVHTCCCYDKQHVTTHLFSQMQSTEKHKIQKKNKKPSFQWWNVEGSPMQNYVFLRMI